jgi:polyhydroxyalkanoate synthesis regulator phasin
MNVDISRPELGAEFFSLLQQISFDAIDQELAPSGIKRTIALRTTQLTHRISDTVSQTFDYVTGIGTQTTTTIHQTTQNAVQSVVNSVNAATNQGITVVSETAQRAKESVGDAVQQSQQAIGSRILEEMETAITAPIQAWLADHPIPSWFITHPLWLIGSILLAILLFWGLLRAIARFTEQLWLVILQAPFRFTHWLFISLPKIILRSPTQLPSASSAVLESRQAKLADILQRLEALRQEQDALMKEVQAILADP